VLLGLWPAVLAAQATTPPAFDVASVKLVVRDVPNHPVGLRINHGTLNVDDGRLRQIIGLAYGIQRVNVLGGPDWIDIDKFTIIAKADSPDATPEQIKLMLQTLLAERFKLALHKDTKEIRVYTLTVGKNGSKLKETPEEEKGSSNVGGTPRGLQMVYRKANILLLVNTLANMLGSPVVDKTGLTGRYDIRLEWTDDRFRRPADSMSADLAPDLFTALEEQLGLKMEVKKGPAEVLVVDHAERASEN
jgi:uncharacterized protein (TIGR03435 family)